MDENVQQPELPVEPVVIDVVFALTHKQALDLANRFTYHPPVGDQPQRYDIIRKVGLALATQIIGLTPPSREQSLALTNVEQAIMWANAAIARKGAPGVSLPKGD